MKHYNYFWWDHLLLRGTGIEKHVEEAIKNHDWIQFKTYQKILNNMVTKEQGNKKWIYLPNYIHVFDPETNKDEIIPLTEDNFKKITFSEYECG